MSELRVNGQTLAIQADAESPLLWVLREDLGLTGTKFGCGIGVCGACTILVDGAPARSCMLALGAIGSRHVTTIEGLSEDGSHPLQRAWLELQVAQCGYCQSGQLMSAAALLRANPAPTRADIDRAMAGNLCRCGTYPRIREAILRAATVGGAAPDGGQAGSSGAG